MVFKFRLLYDWLSRREVSPAVAQMGVHSTVGIVPSSPTDDTVQRSDVAGGHPQDVNGAEALRHFRYLLL